MIDVSDEEESTKKCFKYHQNKIGSLNIAYNESNSMIGLWTKYQIFIHERLNFEGAANVINPEFQIKQSLLVDNYLVCLDFSSNIRILSLKFKHSAAKRSKSNFSQRDNNILIIQEIGTDVVSLKFENGRYYICTYKISADFQLTKKHQIYENITTEKDKCLLFTFALTIAEFESIKSLFKSDNWIWDNHYMLIFSFDKKQIYGCLFSLQSNDEPSFIKLYSSPTEVSNVKMLKKDHLEILIGLTSGSVIKLAINTNKLSSIVHLNTCIDKFIIINDSIIYIDGSTMWRAEEIFENISFRQIFVKQPKDFIQCSDQIICTTYNNFIYIFSCEDDSSYLKSISKEKYSSAEHLLNNIDYLKQIDIEAKKLDKLAKRIKEEKNYTIAVALSNRQDLMQNIHYEIAVFDHYDDILKEDRILTFTGNSEDIFNMDTYYFVISVKTSHLQNHYKDILSNVLKDLGIHITLLTNDRVIKTDTIKVLDELKKVNVVVTLKNEQLDLKANFFVNIKLVTKIPGVLDEKQGLWICVHEKQFQLTSEQFIKSNKSSKHLFLKNYQEQLDDLILINSRNHYGTIFSFMKNPTGNSKEWTYYVRLPSNYKDMIKNEEYCKKTFEKSKCDYIRGKITSEDFLKSQNSINFNIASEKCEISILNDGFSRPILKVTSTNEKVAIDMRNFMSKILYNNFELSRPQEMVVNWSLYSVVETLQRAVKDCIGRGCELEEISDLYHTFQRNIVSNIPI